MSQENGLQESVKSTGKIIKLSDIITLMEEGKTRKEINAIYGQTDAAMKQKVWNHPKLKNKKSAKKYDIQLEDDTEEVEEVAQTNAPVVEQTQAPVEAVEETQEQAEEAVSETTTEESVTNEAPQAEAPATERGTW